MSSCLHIVLQGPLGVFLWRLLALCSFILFGGMNHWHCSWEVISKEGNKYYNCNFFSIVSLDNLRLQWNQCLIQLRLRLNNILSCHFRIQNSVFKVIWKFHLPQLEELHVAVEVLIQVFGDLLRHIETIKNKYFIRKNMPNVLSVHEELISIVRRCLFEFNNVYNKK